MSWTKRELLNQAFAELGLANYVFDLEPEDITLAIRRMDNMIAMWDAKGIYLSYPLTDGANGSDPDNDSLLPDYAISAVTTNLAIQLAPIYGKAVSQESRTNARQAYLTLLSKQSEIPKMQLGEMPAGAGNRHFTDVIVPEELNINESSMHSI